MADTWFTNQETSKTAPNTISEKSAGNRINPGPYVGIVKNVIDPLYSGALQVYIPELGGDPTDKSSYKNMMYATPFYGRTNIQDGNSPDGSPNSYGMWFVPPDIDNKVLCIFANGDPARGYWFACIPDWPALHMVPGISAPVDKGSGYPAPVVDFYDSKDNPSQLASVRTLEKQVHSYQRKIWDAQGLTQDPDRGPGSSSAQRETPTSVFGISTPGRTSDPTDPQLYPDDVGYTSGGATSSSPGQLIGVHGRRGGHTFVMDDGDSNGANQMFRLRSAAGHMIMMNDTKEFIYIINSTGTSWIEMNKEGAINIYAQSQMNVTAKGGFSLETDGAMKLHGKTIDIVADNGLNIQGSDINVLGSGTTKITGKKGLHLKGSNTYLTGDSCIQVRSDGHIDLKGSCTTIQTADATKAQDAGEGKKPEKMPTKEPWAPHVSAPSQTASPTYGSQNNGVTGASGPYGITNNFGSGGAQPNYGPQTNNVPPVSYNDGYQGSLAGQGSQLGSYNSPNATNNTINWTVAGAVAGAVAGIAFGSGAAFNVTGDNSNQKDYSTGELQNNPGNLPYNKNDKFAVGFSNTLAVYAKPEDGIAALSLYFDNLNVAKTTRSIDLIVGFLNAKSVNDPKVIDMTRYMQNNLSIQASDYVALSDPTTRIGWIANVIKYTQSRIIYTYDQVVTGCAEGLGLTKTAFISSIQPVTKPWQNNNGNNPFTGFVNPAQNNNVQNNGSSPLSTISKAIIGGIIGGTIGNILGNSQNNNQGQIIQVSDINAANRYLQSNPDTPSGTVFKYPDGSSFTIGGGSTSFASGSSGFSAVSGPVGSASGASVTFDGIVQNGTCGSGGCATLAQTYAPNLGLTNTWSGGDALSAGTAKPGDVYATFSPDGTYSGISGTNHTVIFNNYATDSNGNITGAYVTEQYVGQPPHTAFYSANSTKYESFNNMQRVQSTTAPNGANVTQTQQYTQKTPDPNQNIAGSGDPTAAAHTSDLNSSSSGDTGRNMVTATSSSDREAQLARIDSGNSANAVQDPSTVPGSNLADKQPGDATGSASAQIQSEQDAIQAANNPQESVPSRVDFAPEQGTTAGTTGSANSGNYPQPTESSGSAMNQLETTPTRDSISSPDAAAYGDTYSQSIANQPTNTVIANPGDLAGGGFGSGSSGSSTTTISQSPDQPPGQSNPGDLAGGGFGSGSSGGTTSNPPITSSAQNAPGTGGAQGVQNTPAGSSQTGAAAKSC